MSEQVLQCSLFAHLIRLTLCLLCILYCGLRFSLLAFI
jgi:hypothetical protein